MTYESLTEIQNTSSIPKFLKASNFSSNAGNCCDDQVGVKAPGNENIKTLFAENKSLEEIDIHALSPSR